MPKTRKRAVERAKSYGSGKRSSDIAERVVALERNALFLEVLGKPGAREHTVGGERRAAVGPAVADEHQRSRRGQRAPLAHVTAHRARAVVTEDHAPALGAHVGVVRTHLDVDAFSLEYRQDEL